MTVWYVCSNKPRPSLHSGRKNGVQHWKRDVYHVSNASGYTACNRAAHGWLMIDSRLTLDQALEDTNFCTQCASIVKNMRSMRERNKSKGTP